MAFDTFMIKLCLTMIRTPNLIVLTPTTLNSAHNIALINTAQAQMRLSAYI